MVLSLGLAVGPALEGELEQVLGYGNGNIVLASISLAAAMLSYLWIGGEPRLLIYHMQQCLEIFWSFTDPISLGRLAKIFLVHVERKVTIRVHKYFRNHSRALYLTAIPLAKQCTPPFLPGGRGGVGLEYSFPGK
jgi:hypothetical protein